MGAAGQRVGKLSGWPCRTVVQVTRDGEIIHSAACCRRNALVPGNYGPFDTANWNAATGAGGRCRGPKMPRMEVHRGRVEFEFIAAEGSLATLQWANDLTRRFSA